VNPFLLGFSFIQKIRVESLIISIRNFTLHIEREANNNGHPTDIIINTNPKKKVMQQREIRRQLQPTS